MPALNRTAGSTNHIPVRRDWLAQHTEAALEPSLPIVDSHHHLYDRPGARYLLDDLLGDLAGGHNVRATVFVQARSMLRANAPPHLQALGETEFANGVAAMSASGIYGQARVCAAIVGHADLTRGDRVRPVLERHIAIAGGPIADGGRFRGVRQTLTWDEDTSLLNPAYPTTSDMMDSREFRAGFAHLSALGLSFEGWVFFHQLPRLAALARHFPETPIVLNHCGGVIGIARYAGQRNQVFADWKRGLTELSRCPNVMVKLSGLGMRLGGFGFEEKNRPPTSAELAHAWAPWIESCIDAFGARRCMYGSNFPVDKGTYSHAIGLNAVKRLVAGATPSEKADIFWRSAKNFYCLPESSLRIQSNAAGNASEQSEIAS